MIETHVKSCICGAKYSFSANIDKMICKKVFSCNKCGEVVAIIPDNCKVKRIE